MNIGTPAPNGAVYSLKEFEPSHRPGELLWSVYIIGPNGSERRIVGGYDGHPFGGGGEGLRRAESWAETDGHLVYMPGEPLFRRRQVADAEAPREVRS